MLDNVAVFRKPHPPLLIIHGQADALVSSANARELYAQSLEPKELLILPQGEHRIFSTGNQYFLAVKSFLDKYTQSKSE